MIFFLKTNEEKSALDSHLFHVKQLFAVAEIFLTNFEENNVWYFAGFGVCPRCGTFIDMKLLTRVKKETKVTKIIKKIPKKLKKNSKKIKQEFKKIYKKGKKVSKWLHKIHKKVQSLQKS